MRLIVCDDRQAAGERLASMLIEAITENPRLVLGLSAGATSLAAYVEVVRRWHEQGGFSFRYATTFNTEEYAGLPPTDHRSTRYLMNCNLFCQVDMPREQTYILRGDAVDLELECRAFDLLIEASGGLGLVALGLGHNGHVGLNEPGSTAKSRTRVIDLTPSTVAAISGGERFKTIEETPAQGITMGLATIIAAKRVLLIACGVGKAEALHKMCEGKVGPNVPASMLTSHPDLTLVVDRAAASRLDPDLIERLS